MKFCLRDPKDSCRSFKLQSDQLAQVPCFRLPPSLSPLAEKLYAQSHSQGKPSAKFTAESKPRITGRCELLPFHQNWRRWKGKWMENRSIRGQCQQKHSCPMLPRVGGYKAVCVLLRILHNAHRTDQVRLPKASCFTSAHSDEAE